MAGEEERLGTVITEVADLLADILEALGGGKNADEWDHGHTTVATPGEPKQLSPMSIPNGMQVVVRALLDNTDNVYVGKSRDMVLNVNKRIALERKDSVRMRLTNASLIWVDAAVGGEGVDYFCEIAKT